MANKASHASVRIVLDGGQPIIEARIRAADAEVDGFIPKGKILVTRTPLLTPPGCDEETQSELIDDDGVDETFCPECAAAGVDHRDLPWLPFNAGSQDWGRNDPCPCGSGKKYKRCCLD